MSRKVFIDCGTHLGMGFSKLIPVYKIDETWEIFGFEANPHVLQGYKRNIEKHDIFKNLNIKLDNRAVWINEELINFSLRGISKKFVDDTPHFSLELDATRDKDLEMMGDGHGLTGDNIYDIPWDGGSCISDLKKSYNEDKPGPLYQWHEDVSIKGLDLSKWILENFNKDDTIILKMDIEGAEFKVIPKMISDGSLTYVDDLYIEWHSWMMSEYSSLEASLKEQVSSRCNMRIWC